MGFAELAIESASHSPFVNVCYNRSKPAGAGRYRVYVPAIP